MHIVVVGGNDAGVSAALRARDLDRSAEVTMCLADDYPNYSICGLPHLIGGQTPDWRDLAHRTEFPGIDVRRHHRVTAFDPAERTVTIDRDGARASLRYDRLIVATGARPIRPSLPGFDLDGVHLLHTMDDGLTLNRRLLRPTRSAVVVGGGYIGLEMAEALRGRGLAVTLLSRSPTVHPSVDAPFGERVAEELRRHEVNVVTGVGAARVDRWGARLSVLDTDGAAHACDVVIVAVGVEPASELAGRAGARLGHRGAVAVTRTMRTSLPEVFAAGDCVETHHRLMRDPTYVPSSPSRTSRGEPRGRTRSVVGGSSPARSGRKASSCSTSSSRGRGCSNATPGERDTTR